LLELSSFYPRLQLPDNPASREVVCRKFHFHPVARKQPYEILLSGSCRMSQHLFPVLELQPKHQTGKFLDHPGFYYGRVNTHGPFLVTATQCSKWAE
jgi:hypothetical protein